MRPEKALGDMKKRAADRKVLAKRRVFAPARRKSWQNDGKNDGSKNDGKMARLWRAIGVELACGAGA